VAAYNRPGLGKPPSEPQQERPGFQLTPEQRVLRSRVGLAALVLVLCFVGASLATTPLSLDVPPRTWPRQSILPVAVSQNGFQACIAAAAKVALPLDLVDDAAARGRFLSQSLDGPALPPEAAAAVGNNQAAFAEIHTALAMPAFQTKTPLAVGVTPPRLGPLVLLAQLGAIDARLRLEEGDTAGGVARGLDMLALGQKMVYEPGAIAVSIRAGTKIEQAALSALGQSLPRLKAFSKAQRAGLAGALDLQAGWRRPVAELEAAQRDFALPLLPALAGETLDQVIDLLAVDVAGYLKASYDRHIYQVDSRDFASMRLELDREEAQDRTDLASWFGLRPKLRAILHPYTGIPEHLKRKLAPPQGLSLVPLFAEARLDGLRVGVAIARYQQDRGAVPTQASELVPNYLPAFPVDPFKPTQSLGFAKGRLWSIGCDGKDQQGLVAVPMGGTALSLLKAPGDIILLPWSHAFLEDTERP
jgi:hypothetical protein